MGSNTDKSPLREAPQLEQIEQSIPAQEHGRDSIDDPERWERTKGLPEEEVDNFPATSDEALPDEREEAGSIAILLVRLTAALRIDQREGCGVPTEMVAGREGQERRA